jgi:hypothetical protein
VHVTLIRPPKITSDFSPHTQSGVPPVALACLAAVLEEAGHGVTVIDAYGEAPSRAVDIPGTNLNTVGLTADEIAAVVPASTDVIGLTCMFSQDWLYAKRVIAAVHGAAPNRHPQPRRRSELDQRLGPRLRGRRARGRRRSRSADERRG